MNLLKNKEYQQEKLKSTLSVMNESSLNNDGNDQKSAFLLMKLDLRRKLIKKLSNTNELCSCSKMQRKKLDSSWYKIESLMQLWHKKRILLLKWNWRFLKKKIKNWKKESCYLSSTRLILQRDQKESTFNPFLTGKYRSR